MILFLRDGALGLRKTFSHRSSGCSRDRAAPVVFLREMIGLQSASAGILSHRLLYGLKGDDAMDNGLTKWQASEMLMQLALCSLAKRLSRDIGGQNCF
jgi:hypothetical protein